jgi:hypothetical protein
VHDSLLIMVVVHFRVGGQGVTSMNTYMERSELSHPNLRTNPNARIHVRQDQVTHMHRLSEYQKHSVKRKESIKQLLHDRMSQLNKSFE